MAGEVIFLLIAVKVNQSAEGDGGLGMLRDNKVEESE